MTWNIWGCLRGLDGVLDELRRQDADVFCLQEADDGFARFDGADLTALIAVKLGYHHVLAGTAVNRGGEAILSRWRLDRVESLDAGTGRLYGITATLDHRGRRVRIVSVHLTCTFKPSLEHVRRTTKARAVEAADLAKRLQAWKEPTVLCGDFNSVPAAPDHEGIARSLARVPTTQPTWSADDPVLAVDHVYHSSQFTVSRFKTVNSKASDHRPIVVELRRTED